MPVKIKPMIKFQQPKVKPKQYAVAAGSPPPPPPGGGGDKDPLNIMKDPIDPTKFEKYSNNLTDYQAMLNKSFFKNN